MTNTLHAIEPELLKPAPRALRFDSSWGQPAPAQVIIVVGLFVLAMFIATIEQGKAMAEWLSVLAMVALACIFLITEPQKLFRTRSLIRSGTAVQGTIAKVIPLDEKNALSKLADRVSDQRYLVAYEFVQDGKKVDATANLDGAQASTIAAGDRVTVVYDPRSLRSLIYKFSCYKVK